MRHVVLGTAGHIDHGKTALVRALTGIDTDRLAEEKRRGITIELGFAPMRLGDDVEASIVDVPGHERLVRTMVAGAGGMDLAMLVVAADDGVMPQTREHLDILRLLGVPRLVVVVTKADLVEADLRALVVEEIHGLLEGTPYAAAPIVEASVRGAPGIEAVRDALAGEARGGSARSPEGPAFLPLDRVFRKQGFGVVVTGTTLRGSLELGEPLEAFGPRGTIEDLKVRGLQAHDAARERVEAGIRTAVNVSGRDAASLERGMVLASAGALQATRSLVARIEVLASADPLVEGRMTLHLGTTERDVHCIPLEARELQPGTEGGVLLKLEAPLVAFAGERLVLRRPGVHGQATVAGGEVLDPLPREGKGALRRAKEMLATFGGDDAERLVALAVDARARGIFGREVDQRLPFAVASAALAAATRQGKILAGLGADHFVAARVVDAIGERIEATVKAALEAQPLAAGLGEAEARSKLASPEQALAPLAIERLVERGKLARQGSMLALSGAAQKLDAETEAQLAAIVAAVGRGDWTPPFERELAAELGIPAARVAHLLGLLRRRGALVQTTRGLHYPPKKLEALREIVLGYFVEATELRATDFKALVGGASRKWAIPLLEYLDAERVTLRVGDVRRLHPKWRTT